MVRLETGLGFGLGLIWDIGLELGLGMGLIFCLRLGLGMRLGGKHKNLAHVERRT